MEVHFIMGEGFDANVFFIEAEKPILIDAGTGWNIAKAVGTIEQHIDPKEIETIVLTHRHIDHVGGAAELSHICQAQLYASIDEAPPLISGDRATTGSMMFNIPLDKLDISILKYDDEVDLGDAKLKIIHTPGHTMGSISLYHEETKSLFSGDTVFADGGVGRWDFETGSYRQLVASIEMLKEMGPKNLYPGHGPYVENEATEHIGTSLKFLRYAEIL
ncbi:MAG: MBL fold metallo-hydrolase [Methanobacteriota archaeon]|nr:MAG: MBL fold metallo-hydrolase [Euryarchaeota archaeon]